MSVKIKFNNPFSTKGNWYKGNIHTHTTNSDGELSPKDVISLYHGKRYVFLAITDHHKLTYSEELQKEGLYLIPGEEIDGGKSVIGASFHIVALNIKKEILFANKEKIIVIFGDNIMEESLQEDVKIFEKQASGARLFLKKVDDPCRFGIAETKNNKIINVEEKPQNPKSDLAVMGIYIYDKQIFDIIRTLKPSARGEYEITDVNNFYIKNDTVTYRILNKFLSDAGTFKSLHQAACFMAKKQNKTI